jgi:hypothetical protein
MALRSDDAVGDAMKYRNSGKLKETVKRLQK